MKIKAPFIVGLGLFLCVAGLFLVYFFSRGSRTLCLALPNEISSPKININRIEDFSETDFLLTYEIPLFERVSLAYGSHPVTLIGTNSSYAQIMGLSIAEGAFFSKQAWNGKLRHAVLNEKAAFAIFGSSQIVNNRFQIRNETWLVTGVIRDNDDERAKIFIPSSIRGGEAASIAMTTSGGLDEAFMINNLKTLGIREVGFDFISFGNFTGLFLERAWVIMLFFFILLFLSLIKPLIVVFFEIISKLKKDLELFYITEIPGKRRKALPKYILYVFGLICSPVLALFLLLQLVSICLHWQDIPSLASLNSDLFFPHLSRLCSLETVSLLLFIFAIVILGVFFICLNLIINKSLKIKKSLANSK